MRVVINASAAVAGGSLTYLHNIVPSLAAIDHTNEYWVLQSNWQPRLPLELPANFHVLRVNLPARSVLGRLAWEQTVLPFWLSRRQGNVLFAPTDIAPLAGSCPVVLAIRNPNPYYAVSGLARSSAKFKVQKWMTRLSAHRARRVVFVSNHSRDVIAPQLGMAPEKTRVIYHGLDHSKFDPHGSLDGIPAQFRERVEGLRPFVLCVSTINPHKNYETLLRGWAGFDPGLRAGLRLVVAGRASTPNYLEGLVRLSQELCIHDQVAFLGEVPYGQIVYLYRCASAFVLPSFLETFGHPLVEAMAMGVPVVAARASCIPEIVQEAAVLFEPSSADDCARSLSKVLTDRSLAEHLVARGIARAADFSWARSASQTLDVLLEAVREGRGAGQ